MNRIKGKHVVITGASAGIGEACARCFASYGATLTLWARRFERLENLCAELEKQYDVTAVPAGVDVRERSEVEAATHALLESAGPPAILVNNAGLAAGLSKIYEGDFEDWDRMIDTNVKGLLNVTRNILPVMVEHDEGHVINIGSVAGHMVYPKGNVYNATKYAVRALSEAMNVDLFGTRVRVSSVDPGACETEFSIVRYHGDGEKAKATYRGFEPLAAEDVADAVCYVANAPEHVTIADLVIMPTDQRNPYLIQRKES
ncbi:MAG: SDR family NAD(P)-dependent oxidoreductase [Candidatus Krumholzibacteriota bacterium]|nr:SDR family NAD(P)-dependent oxidoreductase [Candidatus Krumholzibacteriota bacterium]